MQRLILPTLLGLAAALVAPDASSHGGTYRGPGDTVPPGAGGGGGGGGPATPGPSNPGTPGPVGPVSGPVTGGTSSGIPGRGPGNTPTTGVVNLGVDLTVWDFWWAFNRDPYLDLKSRVHGDSTQTGSAEFYLGYGQKDQAQDKYQPTQRDIREKVVPALKHALETERNNDIITGALIALAKIGDVVSEDGRSEFEEIIREFLKDPSQEVAETAAIALGILANDDSIRILTWLATDHRQARSYLGKTEVPYRTRAFAAYGLGLLGHRTSDNELRQDIAETLVDLLNSRHFATRDIKVAAMIAFGLTPVDSNPTTVLEEAEQASNRRHVDSREHQLDFLLDYFDPTQERKHNTTRKWFVRAHAPTAMARLLPGLEGDYRERAARVMLDSLRKTSKARVQVQMSCTLALGEIGDASWDGEGDIDVAIRKELVRLVKDSDEQVRRFALIALAQSGGTPGDGEQGTAGVARVRRELLRALAQANSLMRPWAGLALGVLARRLTDNKQPFDDASMLALQSEADDCRVPTSIGAYLVGLGIAGYSPARDLCIEKMEYFTGSDDARGYAAVALGLMHEGSAILPIQEVIKHSEYKPELLKQAAIALGLLGDKELVPELITMLREARGLATQAAISTALGAIGDSRSIDPLVEMLGNSQITPTARGFAAVALGIVCDKEPLPWNSKISNGINYRANTVTLTGAGGTGILDIL